MNVTELGEIVLLALCSTLCGAQVLVAGRAVSEGIRGRFATDWNERHDLALGMALGSVLGTALGLVETLSRGVASTPDWLLAWVVVALAQVTLAPAAPKRGMLIWRQLSQAGTVLGSALRATPGALGSVVCMQVRSLAIGALIGVSTASDDTLSFAVGALSVLALLATALVQVRFTQRQETSSSITDPKPLDWMPATGWISAGALTAIVAHPAGGYLLAAAGCIGVINVVMHAYAVHARRSILRSGVRPPGFHGRGLGALAVGTIGLLVVSSLGGRAIELSVAVLGPGGAVLVWVVPDRHLGALARLDARMTTSAIAGALAVVAVLFASEWWALMRAVLSSG